MKNTSNILEEGYNVWGYLIGFLLSTGNRLYVGWFGTLMLPLSGLGPDATGDAAQGMMMQQVNQ